MMEEREKNAMRCVPEGALDTISIRAQHRVIAMLGADDPTEERARETKKKCNELAGDIF